MEKQLIDRIKLALLGLVDPQNVDNVVTAVCAALNSYDVKPKSNALVTYDKMDDELFNLFFLDKIAAGLSKNSLTYYRGILAYFFNIVQKHVTQISEIDIRLYLANQLKNGKSPVSLNNELRVLSSFYGSLFKNKYVTDNPVAAISKVKAAKRIKTPFTELEVETMRAGITDIRDKALIEFMLSTGCRCSEITGANISDIDWGKSCLNVVGKGNKERTVYLSPRCVITLKDYLNNRDDRSEALFVCRNSANIRLQRSGIERVCRRIGKALNIPNCHPHRFRRTCATFALRRGMPIDQVRMMLGHNKLDTTMIYAITSEDDVRHNHAKYVF